MEKRISMDELRLLILKAPEFKPFRDKMVEMMIRVAKRKIEKEKCVQNQYEGSQNKATN
ncbi:MAG TPA: hypothetical protein VIO64_05600 [Pseudobacteroides sp.]|uniref:hypothetical protein n=1 Tax=Pseudobacteroides sp. TaxID=1968840 RepID=UPI002F930957